MLSDRCLSCLSVCLYVCITLVYCDQTVGWIKMKLGKKGQSPQILAHVYCGQTAGWIRMPCIWYGGRPQPRRHCVRWEPSSPSPKGEHTTPQFSANVRCGWTKMPLGIEVGFGPGDLVFCGNPKGTAPYPIFGPCMLWPNDWMDQDATWYGGKPRPRPECVQRRPSSPAKGAQQPPLLFGPCLLWPRSPISTAAELLFRTVTIVIY